MLILLSTWCSVLELQTDKSLLLCVKSGADDFLFNESAGFSLLEGCAGIVGGPDFVLKTFSFVDVNSCWADFPLSTRALSKLVLLVDVSLRGSLEDSLVSTYKLIKRTCKLDLFAN